MTAFVLTVIAVAIGIACVAAYGRDGLLVYAPSFVVGIPLLWASTTAKRFDERDDLVEA
jgi:hypothetical protein